MFIVFVHRFFQWIFTKLESSVSDEVKILLLTALSKVNRKHGYLSSDLFCSLILDMNFVFLKIVNNQLIKQAVV